MTHSSDDTLARRFMVAAQYVLVATFGLLPVFFIPSPAAPFTYSKVLFILAGTLIALVLFGFAAVRSSGTVQFRYGWAPLALWGVAAVAVVSAVLSGDMRDALLGDVLSVHTALFVALLALVATAWSLIGTSKAAVMRLFVLLSISTLLLSCFHLVRLAFGPDFLSLVLFSGDATLSPFGGWNDLAIFFGLAIVLALVAVEQLSLTRSGIALFSLVAAAALVMLAVINFFAVWVVLGLISLGVLVYALMKGRMSSKKEDRRSTSGAAIGISLVVFCISVLFVLGGSMLGGKIGQWVDISYLEVRPSISATADIVRNVYQTDLLFGIGPNRFADAWRLFKDPAINTSMFWNIDFVAGFGYLPTFFATTGIMGGILWLLFLGTFVFFGMHMLLRPKVSDPIWYFIGTVSFVGGLYVWCMSIVYVPGPALLLVAALCTGISTVSYGALMRIPAPTALGSKSRHAGFAFILGFVLLVVGSVSLLYMVGRHYASVYVFNTSVLSIATQTSIEELEQQTVFAYELYPNDAYVRRLAEYQLARMQGLLAVAEPTEAQREEFNTALNNGISAGQAAVAHDRREPNNWSTLGSLYGTLVPLEIEGAYERAVEALTQAQQLDPHNPRYVLMRAQIAYAADREDEARTLVEEAVALKGNYSDALYFLSQIDIATGDVPAAIAAAQAVTTLEPNNPVRFFQLGLLYYAAEQYTNAAAAFERATALDRQYANARYYLALTYDQLGRANDARTQLAIVLQLNPGNEHVTELLARLARGESIADAASSEVPLTDSAIEVDGNAVTASEAPDTPLVTPVNTPSVDEVSEGE